MLLTGCEAGEPVSETYMKEGISRDDGWRLVEDEFLATARFFSAHLHVAEYLRLESAEKPHTMPTHDSRGDVVIDQSVPGFGPVDYAEKMAVARMVSTPNQQPTQTAPRLILLGDRLPVDDTTEELLVPGKPATMAHVQDKPQTAWPHHQGARSTPGVGRGKVAPTLYEQSDNDGDDCPDASSSM
jgi:hypothetical protein